MSTAWRVIDLTQTFHPIDIRPGRLIHSGTAIPLHDVAVILTGEATSWSGALIAEAARFDITILACDWRGIPIAGTLPWSHNTRIAARHHAQANLALPRKKNAWMRIVKAKIHGQASNLQTHAPDAYERLQRLAQTVRSGDPTNVEAQAARTYWTRFLPGRTFTRHADGDGLNSALNYGYAVLRGYVVRSIITAGLSPTLGIWHHSRANPFGLADDLLEPFRPAVDHLARAVDLDEPELTADTRHQLVSVLSTPMDKSGSTVSTAISDLAAHFARYAEHQERTLDVPTWQAPDG